MAQMSDYLENAIVKHLFRTGSYTKPTELNIALYTAAPSDAGGGTEVGGGKGYARVNLPPLDANWAATSGIDGHTDNLSAITFGAPTADWGTITHVGIFDESGNLLLWGALTTPKTVNNGDPAPSFAIAAFEVTFD